MFGIPTWVVGLFLVLVYIGIKRCSTRVMPLKKMAIAPIIFILFSLNSVSDLFTINVINSILLFSGFVAGNYFGYLQVKDKRILADKEKYLIQIPGDFSLLVSLMLVFLTVFSIHYIVDAHWAISDLVIFKVPAIIVSGVVIGLTLGRTLAYLHQFITSSHVPLSLPVKN